MLKKLWMAIVTSLATIGTLPAAEATLTGAGASFPAPVYQDWCYNYSALPNGVKVNYQSLGSGAGLNQIRANTVDFAGSDNPLTLAEQEQDGLIQFPMLTGGVVIIANLPGIANNTLSLDGTTLADIYLGKITSWDDDAIKTLNPARKLPSLKITVVRRADSSGTSFIFTNYLSKVSPEWEKNVGCGPAVKWPVGLGGQKNPGVCNNVAKIRGSIGYTEYTYALEASLPMVTLKNRDGKLVAASVDSFSAAAANADWKNAPGYYMILTDQPGAESWPIVGVTYVLFRKDCPADKAALLKQYFTWCFDDGAEAARRLSYVPIPANVVQLVKDTVLK